MNRTELTAEQGGYLDRVRSLVAEAETHFLAAVDANDTGEDKALGAALRSLGASFRALDREFKSMAKAAVQSDIAKSQQVQTSSGTGKSTGSAGGRATVPQRATPGLMTGDVVTFLDRA